MLKHTNQIFKSSNLQKNNFLNLHESRVILNTLESCGTQIADMYSETENGAAVLDFQKFQKDTPKLKKGVSDNCIKRLGDLSSSINGLSVENIKKVKNMKDAIEMYQQINNDRESDPLKILLLQYAISFSNANKNNNIKKDSYWGSQMDKEWAIFKRANGITTKINIQDSKGVNLYGSKGGFNYINEGRFYAYRYSASSVQLLENAIIKDIGKNFTRDILDAEWKSFIVSKNTVRIGYMVGEKIKFLLLSELSENQMNFLKDTKTYKDSVLSENSIFYE